MGSPSLGSSSPLRRENPLRSLLASQIFRYCTGNKAGRIFLLPCRPDALVGIHSDGAVFPYIQDFIDIGCTILNPLQTTAGGMDAQTVAGAFGKKISFWAGIDTQHLLPFESAETVEKEVEATIRLFAAGSGYLVAPAHNIASGTGVDNVMAMFAP